LSGKGEAARLKTAMTSAAPGRRGGAAIRAMFLAAGLACVGLGVVGAFVPLMPSTIFFIAAAACFARSSARLERMLMSHPIIGEAVRAWRARGAIPVKAKWLASAGMGLGLLLLAATNPPILLMALACAALIACALFVWTRPS
jgi:uncharacterized membrane protein YbaN (DUF454 family)